MGHRVAPDPLVDLLALDHRAGCLGEHLHELELAPGQLEALPGDEAPGTGRPGSRARRRPPARPRRGDGCAGGGGRPPRSAPSPPPGAQGFAIQSSAPSRRPRTRWATVEPWVQTTTPRSGSISQTRSRKSQPIGPSRPRSTSSAFSFIATSSSGGRFGGLDPVLPAGGVEAPGEYAEEAAVVVDHRKTDCPVVRHVHRIFAGPRTTPRRPVGGGLSLVSAHGSARPDVEPAFTGLSHANSRFVHGEAIDRATRLEPTRDPLSLVARAAPPCPGPRAFFSRIRSRR